MFIVTTLSDLIQIHPIDFQKPTALALKDNINEKYANKVIQKVGLCICLWDMLKVGDGLIGQGTGIVNVNVEFRLVVFRPFKGEIIKGKISASDDHGIGISLDFFGDITVPAPVNLFDGTSFNKAEGAWVWTTDVGDELYFDLNEIVRARIEAEEWHDQSPQGPIAPSANEVEEEPKSPYSIIASMQIAGLGLTGWWDGLP